MHNRTTGKKQVGMSCGVNMANNNSYYNKRLRTPVCGINNTNKVSIINIIADNVCDESMYCDDTYKCLCTTIDDTTGKVEEIVCRKQIGCIGSASGIYIVTVWKKNTG